MMKEILSLDNMITPKLITFIYWILLVGAVIFGLQTIFTGYGSFFGRLFQGLLYAISGAFFARLWCELLIVLFKMNEALQEIKNK
jgi:hypothetical protein